MHINSIQSYNSYNQNFGAEISGNPNVRYLRTQIRNIAHGDWEQKNLLLSLLKVIKNDKNFDTFEMKTTDTFINRKSFNKYCFTLFKNGGKKVVVEHTPYFSDEQQNGEYYEDKHFLNELEYFIKKHYGEDVYKKALKNKPKYVKEYLQMQENINNRLKADIKETINMEPLNYLLLCNGTKIPTDSFGMPIDDYVC